MREIIKSRLFIIKYPLQLRITYTLNLFFVGNNASKYIILLGGSTIYNHGFKKLVSKENKATTN